MNVGKVKDDIYNYGYNVNSGENDKQIYVNRAKSRRTTVVETTTPTKPLDFRNVNHSD